MRKLFSLIIMALSLQSCINETGSLSNQKKKDDNSPPRTEEDTTPPVAKFFNEILPSLMYRDHQEKQLSYFAIKNAMIKKTLSDRFHSKTPDSQNDHDQRITLASTTFKDCGHLDTYKTIASKIANCEKVNNLSYFWNGDKNGISGEGYWRLIQSEGTKVRFWQDDRTKLIWSHNIGTATWNLASGQEENLNACLALNTFSQDQISWRLPNRNEFLQADINGARFVLDQTRVSGYWTASIGTESANQAWMIVQNTGVLALTNINSKHNVRCIGIVLK
jgi:hypothetical protein